MPEYKIRINHVQVFFFFMLVILVPFTAFFIFVFWGKDDAQGHMETFILIALPIFACIGAAMFTLATTLFFNSKLSLEGVEYRTLLMGKETLEWSEVDDVVSQLTFPYFILRKRLPDGFSSTFEGINNVQGSKVCCLPKMAFLQDQEGFVTYLDRVLPPDHKLRACYL